MLINCSIMSIIITKFFLKKKILTKFPTIIICMQQGKR